jgi:O-acetyl-ADP-ribose deacetylase (regulator of RNase III)
MPAAPKIEIVEGDITRLAVDAIVNAANNQLWMGGGVAGAIKRAGGEGIERELMAMGPIEAGRLQARYVIHGAVMGQDLKTSTDLIRRTTRRCLEVADDLGCDSIALPALGTGVGGFPLDESACLKVGAARSQGTRSLRRIVFVVFGEAARRAFEIAVAEATSGSSHSRD